MQPRALALSFCLSALGEEERAVRLPGGQLRMGPGSPEGPVRAVRVRPFAIDKCPVTNGEFR